MGHIPGVGSRIRGPNPGLSYETPLGIRPAETNIIVGTAESP